MRNVDFSKTDTGYRLVLKATVDGDYILPHSTETLTFDTEDCFFIYDTLCLEPGTIADITINDKQYRFSSQLWMEMKDIIAPYAMFEFDCNVSKRKEEMDGTEETVLWF